MIVVDVCAFAPNPIHKRVATNKNFFNRCAISLSVQITRCIPRVLVVINSFVLVALKEMITKYSVNFYSSVSALVSLGISTNRNAYKENSHHNGGKILIDLFLHKV
ncbi:hypothetical protein IJ707_06435 [bacterium]|nr:hypothetical protein [bacterium]